MRARVTSSLLFLLLLPASPMAAAGKKHEAATSAPSRLLEIYALDIWAQPLPSRAKLTVTKNGAAVETSGFPVAQAPLTTGAYRITIGAARHHDLDLGITFDGTDRPESLVPALVGRTPHGVAVSYEVRSVAGRSVPVHTVYIGLRHRWFSAQGRPARRGNELTLLVGGEEAFQAIHREVKSAKKSIHISTWWWESTFEPLRDFGTHAAISPEARSRNTILSLIEASPAYKRVLVGQFVSQDGMASSMTSDAALRAHGEKTGDSFDFMGQANEVKGVFTITPASFVFGDRVRTQVPATSARRFATDPPIASTIGSRRVDSSAYPTGVAIPHASQHQKFTVVDGTVAFVGGMNYRKTDWDTSRHFVFEHRRMPFDASKDDRLNVRNKEALPPLAPRRDYMIRVRGPVVQDAAEVFKKRWDLQRQRGVQYADKTTTFEVDRSQMPFGDGIQAQVTTTLPPPLNEHSILETRLNAVAHAREYIYIEDQYFRIPLLNEAIANRMNAVPGLRLIVITLPVSEWTDPGCAWTHKSHAFFKSRFPTRYMMLQLRSFDTQKTWGWDSTKAQFVNVNTHSKMLIVDDLFLSAGSANMNNRGVLYEGEMNIAVLSSWWVRNARRRILANLLPPNTPQADDVATWWNQFLEAARFNDAVRAKWKLEGDDIRLTDGATLAPEYKPKGFVYSLDFRSLSDCLVENVGPDVM